jgi:hypothetical protein
MPELITINDLKLLSKPDLRDMLKWAQDLNVMYHQFISADDEEVKFEVEWYGAKQRASGIHASEISGCMRPTVYSLMGVERRDVTDPFWKKRFRIGHAVHAMIQDDLYRMCEDTGGAMTFESEVSISPNLQPRAAQWNLHSHCDGIIRYYDHPGDTKPIMRVGVEIKTESDKQFEDLKAPRDYHLEQTCVYMRVLDLPLMWTLYYNKSNSNIVESKPPWLFTFDSKMERLWGKLENKFANFMGFAEAGELPERIEGLKCEFCPFAWTCGPDWAKRKEARKKRRSDWNKKRRRNKPGRRRLSNGS